MNILFLPPNANTIHAALFLLRIMTGLIMFVAGAGKVMGWFGGFGMEQTLVMFKTGMSLAPFWVYVSCYTEFLGGALLMLGFLTRPAALFVFINMLVAVIIHGTDKFFFGGGAYPSLIMICALVFLLCGAGAWSVDGVVYSSKLKVQTRGLTSDQPKANGH